MIVLLRTQGAKKERAEQEEYLQSFRAQLCADQQCQRASGSGAGSGSVASAERANAGQPSSKRARVADAPPTQLNLQLAQRLLPQ
eukprot:1330099-Alexandrium_andersonii.AAC.1